MQATRKRKITDASVVLTELLVWRNHTPCQCEWLLALIVNDQCIALATDQSNGTRERGIGVSDGDSHGVLIIVPTPNAVSRSDNPCDNDNNQGIPPH